MKKTRKYPIDKIQCSICKSWKSLNSQPRLNTMINNPVSIMGNGGGGSENILRERYKCRNCRPRLLNQRKIIPITNHD